MRKAIEIEFLRISPDGQFMEFSINCPSDYYFTDFRVQINNSEDWYSIKESLFMSDGEYKKSVHDYTAAIRVSEFGVTEPSIYAVLLEALHDSESESSIYSDFEESHPAPEHIEKRAMISDVHHVYNCMLDQIHLINDNCTDEQVMNKLIRNYLVLYGHQEAMAHWDFEEAFRLFNKMKNCFNDCQSSKSRFGGSTCGCSGTYNKVESSCGCHK